MTFIGKPPEVPKSHASTAIDVNAAIWLVPAAMMVVAMATLPYGYYKLLRVVSCGAAAFLAYRSYKIGMQGWAVVLAGIAVIYNPLVPLHLGRAVWTFVNPVTAAVLGIHFWKFGRKRG